MFIEPDFVNIPYVYTSSPESFRSLFESAKTTMVESIMLGDSQETVDGFGRDYIPRFNYNLFLTYRNSPGTPFVKLYNSTGGGAPFCDWLVQTKIIGGFGPISSRINPNMFLPGTRGIATSLLGSSVVNPSEIYGQMLVLRQDGSEISPGANLPDDVNFIDTSEGVYLDVIAGTNQSSGEVKFNVRPSNNLSFFAAITQTITSSMGLEQESFSIKNQTFGPITWNGPRYLQTEIFGSSSTKFTDVMAARFRSAHNDRGILLSSLSVGGYNSHSLLFSHENSGDLLAAINPKLIFINYGANDSGGYTPQQFKNYVLEDIAWAKSYCGPETLFVILTDPVRSGSAQIISNIENYPRVLYEIALDDPNVLFINSIRKLYDLGWNSQNITTYLADVVHYNSYGARLKADTEASMIFDPFVCKADFNSDGFLDFFDYDEFVSSFSGNSPFCDYNRDDFVDFFDYDQFVFDFEIGC